MENFFTRYRNETILLAVLFAQVIALATQVRVPVGDTNSGAGGSTRLIRVWAAGIFTPFQKLYANSSSAVEDLWSHYVDLRQVRRQNEDLLQQIQQMRLEETRSRQDAEQGRRLQALLGFKEQFIARTLAAQVIGTSGTDLARVIYIDRGAADGVEVGMAVITPDGIVGKISRADRSSAQVLLISDPMSGAGVLIERLRLNGILKGAAGDSPEVLNVMADEKIAIGDRIITTGGDRVFPKGLAVGTVTSVTPDRERDSFLAIRIKTAVDLSRLEEVLVVTELGERQPAVEEASAPSTTRAADLLSERLPALKKKPLNEGKTPSDPGARSAPVPSGGRPEPMAPAGNGATPDPAKENPR